MGEINMADKLLTRQQLGETLYQQIKAEIESRGFSLYQPNFDPDYPVSLRTINYIRKGNFVVERLNGLPGVEVGEFFTLK